MAETRRAICERRISAMKTERSSWESHWRDLARFLSPRRGRFFLNESAKGEKRHQDIINGTPLFAARTLSAGMMAGITSPARPWFRLTTSDPSLAESEVVKLWLSDVEQRMRDVFAKSNLYQALPVFYHELGVFGTSVMAALEDDTDVIRFQPFTIGSYWLAQSAQLKVDTFAREFKMTVRQCVEEYGIDKVSVSTKMQYEQGNLESWVNVVHLVEPNDKAKLDKKDAAGMKWRSVYYEQGVTDAAKQVLRETGFLENPILAARWTTTAEDIYGSSPGMDALGDAKSLQVQEKRKAMAIDKFIDPPMNAPGEMINTKTSLLPGDVNYLATPNAKFEPAYQTTPQITPLLEDIAQLEKRINTAFYADLFLMLTMDARAQPPTAEEIRAREQEKLLMLGPVLERLNDEVLDPLIDRTFAIMVRRSEPYWTGLLNGTPMIPEPPAEISGLALKVEYISVLAQSQKQVGLSAQDRLVGYVMNTAQANPAVLDKFDWDQAVDEYSNMLGAPPRLVVDDKRVAQIRAVREKQQTQMQMASMAKPIADAAGAVKSASETPLDTDSLLNRLMGGQAKAQPA